MILRKRIITLLFCFSLIMTPAWVAAIEVGTPAPGFALKSLAGQEVSLADFKGQLVLLKLATTWCPTCKQLSAEINQVGAFLKEQNVVVLEVFIQDSPAMVERYLGDKEMLMDYLALIDDGQAHKAYSVYLIPRLLVIDAEQTVRFDTGGRNLAAEDLVRLVKEFNRQKPAAGLN